MLSKIRVLNQFRHKFNFAQSKDVWNDVDHFYHPKIQPQFQNNKCNLFSNELYNSTKYTYLLIGGAATLFVAFCAKKIYNFSERTWMGVFVYSLFGICLSLQMRNVSNQFQRIIINLHLQPCGRKVLVEYPNFLSQTKSFECDISKISRPKDIDQNIYQMFIAFPVLFNNNLYYLQRDQDSIKNKEILPAVLNAKYIYIQQ